MNKSFGLLLLLLVSHTIYAATYNTTTTDGNWATGSTWVGSAVPGDWASNVANIYGNVSLTSSTTSLNGFSLITLNDGKSFTSGTSSVSNSLSMSQVTFNVASGNIVIYGDLTLNDTDLNIASGSLTVTGTLTINYSSTVTIQSGVNVTVGTLNINNNSDAILNNSGSITVTGNVSQGGVLNNLSTGALQVNGNFNSTGSGSSVTTNNGLLNVTGDIDLPSSGKLYVNPGGQTYVDGNVTVYSNENLVIGTSVNPPPYADMVIKQDLISQGSGDITINTNGRLAVFGDVRADGGGTFFTINSGGQVFINGDIDFNGGGNTVDNNNTTSPYGLYGDGSTSINGGGSGVDGHEKESIATMFADDKPFYDWVASLSGSPITPLPVKLLYFKIGSVAFNGIKLKWATTKEENFDYFQLERAGSDLNFQPVTQIEGEGNLEATSYYEYFDGAAKTGKNYYRLKSVDLDGYFEYSAVIVAEVARVVEDIKLYPTIVDNSFTIEFNDEVSIPVRMVLTDAAGNTIYQESLTSMTSTVEVPAGIETGTYLVRLFTSSGQKAIRVFKK